MNRLKDESLEYRDDIPETILDFKGLRKAIKDFKVDKAIDVLMRYYDKNWIFSNGETYSRFLPTTREDMVDSGDTGTHNIGIFSTALCLEAIAAYKKNVDGCIDVWENGRDRRVAVCDRKTPNRRKIVKQDYSKEIAHSHFEFIINGLSGDFKVKYGFLAKIASLVRFGNFLDLSDIRKNFITEAEPSVQKKFRAICGECIGDFQERFLTRREGIHPFELYRFLQFVRIWDNELTALLVEPEKVLKRLTLDLMDPEDTKESAAGLLNRRIKKQTAKTKSDKVVFRYFFNEVYLFAKYELYRQISLKHSGDSRLYDAKRLIYALLIVYLDNRFSNTLIRNKALALIFSPFEKNRNYIWPTGQQVAMSKDGLMIVSDNECVCDLLGCEYLSAPLLEFISELKCIYDGYARTKRVADGKITGWYPIQQRDQTPTSWTSAFTLSFIKRFCKLVSLKLAMKAKEKFRSNYRKPSVEWNNIYDSSAAKAKIRLMFPEDCDCRKSASSIDKGVIQNCRYRTAILFGPPGTGKTTYGRALATKLKLDYLELTPGDFFSGGEDSILVTINDIFEHLLHLKDTVVFIDEIDDLVKDRNPREKGNKSTLDQPYDRRTLFVNSLLPRFQDLHDNGNIILLMATNNIERVDEAISRMGRVDLVIPVGALSPHGRLKFLHNFYKPYEDILRPLLALSKEEMLDLVVEYLNATEAFNYSSLKQYSEMIIDVVKKIQSADVGEIQRKIANLLQVQTINKEKKEKDKSLLIWQDDVIRKDREYDTRPRYEDGDFQDFRHFSHIEEFPETKKRFQKAFIQLYFNLNMNKIDATCANDILSTISFYCNPFLMEESEPKKSKMFTGRLFNIMTPFLDDILAAIERARKDDDKVTEERLERSKECTGNLIFKRAMLPE